MDWSAAVQLVSGLGASGTLVTVLWLIATGKLVPGATHEEMRADRDYYREKFNATANILGTLLSAVEVEEEGGR